MHVFDLLQLPFAPKTCRQATRWKVMALNYGLLKQWMEGIQTIKSGQELSSLVGKFKELILFLCSQWARKYQGMF